MSPPWRSNALRNSVKAALSAVQDSLPACFSFCNRASACVASVFICLAAASASPRSRLRPSRLRVELVGRLAPGLGLGGRYLLECGLLLFDLLADSVEISFDLGFEAVPLYFQLRLGRCQAASPSAA